MEAHILGYVLMIPRTNKGSTDNQRFGPSDSQVMGVKL